MNRQQVRRDLDKWVSWYVRKRDGMCVTCRTPLTFSYVGFPNSLEWSHYIKRAESEHTRWNLMNGNCQCEFCNNIHITNQVPYHTYMIKKYGLDAVSELAELSKCRLKIPTPVLYELLQEIKQKYKDLE